VCGFGEMERELRSVLARARVVMVFMGFALQA
jgi:hypothetical protein